MKTKTITDFQNVTINNHEDKISVIATYYKASINFDIERHAYMESHEFINGLNSAIKYILKSKVYSKLFGGDFFLQKQGYKTFSLENGINFHIKKEHEGFALDVEDDGGIFEIGYILNEDISYDSESNSYLSASFMDLWDFSSDMP